MMIKKIKLEDKFYLVNHENYFEFDEDDVIRFIDYELSDLDVIGDAKVYKDDRGLYILQRDNFFGHSKDTGYELKKYYETGSDFTIDIKVKINNLKVDHHYYSFDYELEVNGKPIEGDRYEGEHAWQDDKEGFYNLLKNGHAAHCVLENRVLK